MLPPDIRLYGLVAIWLTTILICLVSTIGVVIVALQQHPVGSPSRAIDDPCNRMPAFKGTLP